jgi:hypothetical protein
VEFSRILGLGVMKNLHRTLLANLTLPSDAELLAFLGLVFAIVLSLVGFCVGLKLQLGPRRRAGLWLTWVSIIVAGGLLSFIFLLG